MNKFITIGRKKLVSIKRGNLPKIMYPNPLRKKFKHFLPNSRNVESISLTGRKAKLNKRSQSVLNPMKQMSPTLQMETRRSYLKEKLIMRQTLLFPDFLQKMNKKRDSFLIQRMKALVSNFCKKNKKGSTEKENQKSRKVILVQRRHRQKS